MDEYTLTITGYHWKTLHEHLFPGDGREHGAALLCGIASTPSGKRLLVHDVVPAIDGVDYVRGTSGHHELDAEFVTRNIVRCADEGLMYLAVHCHGGTDSVGFSNVDLSSHARGYPSLVSINDGIPVGALVFADNAVAGDIWHEDGTRATVSKLTVIGPRRQVLRPEPEPKAGYDPDYDRQSRIFGDRGQATLRAQKVAVVGLGGAGSLISQMLARLGVGELVLVDPDRVETSNLPRVVGARRLDAMTWLTDEKRPGWVQKIGKRLSTPKVTIAKRVAREASADVTVTTMIKPVDRQDVARQLSDCDQIFLAADSQIARNLVNDLAHQYLVPFTHVGAKVLVAENGDVDTVLTVMQSNTPGLGCMWCNGLINPDRLLAEATPSEQLERQRYVDDEHVVAPSVITLNAVATAEAVNDWMMRVTRLIQNPDYTRWLETYPLTSETREEEPSKAENCPHCGARRFARGDAVPLPIPAKD